MKVILATAFCVAVGTSVQALSSSIALPPWGQRLGWVLIHSTWQLTLIAVVAALVLSGLRRRSARLRYVVAVGFFGLMLIVPLATWMAVPVAKDVSAATSSNTRIAVNSLPTTATTVTPVAAPSSVELGAAPSLAGDEPKGPRSLEAVAASPADPTEVVRFGNWFERTRTVVAPWLNQIVFVWLVGVLLFSIRPIWGLWTQGSLRRLGLSAATEDAERLTRELSRRMGLTRLVRVAQSSLAPVPMVVGYLRPLILLPASVLVGMTPTQLESLLAHELAHIRRHDWIVNASQVVVETLLFYHPAVWWLSYRIRCERELCCDDLAVAVIGDKLTYGKMLLALEELRQGIAVPALAATGGDLVERIERLMSHRRPRERSRHAWFAGTTALALLTVGSVGWLVATTAASPVAISNPEVPVEGSRLARTDRNVRPTEDGRLPEDIVPPLRNKEAKEKPIVPLAEDNKVIVRGQIVTADKSPLPADLKLQKRVTGSNFAEWPKDVAVNTKGEFSFEVDRDAAFVRLYATSPSTPPASSSRFEVKRGTPVPPVTITLHSGYTARLQLRAEDGSKPTSGTAAVSLRNSFEPLLGTFQVGADGVLEIPHCPNEPVQVDLLMPGFEEQRIHRLLKEGEPIDIAVRPAKPVQLRVLSAGKPVQGATIRLFSRVRANSFLKPLTHWGEGPVWATTDAQGRALLTTLCETDPVPTNDPGPADYAFRIEASGMAAQYIGSVRAGTDLGDIMLTPALRVDGEIVRDGGSPERVTVQVRQRTIAQGSMSGKGDWNYIKPEEVNGRLMLKLTGLQPGPFDLFITFSDSKTPENSVGGTLSQLQFHGNLSGNSTGLRITRSAVTPGDGNLVATRESLFPIDEMPPSNLPKHIVEQFASTPVTVTGPDGKLTIEVATPKLKVLLAWSTVAPVQHSMGHVAWNVIVLQDGTVIVPPSSYNDAGALHRLTADELKQVTAQFDAHTDVWAKLPPEQPPEQGAWRNGHESIQFHRDGKLQTYIKWYTASQDAGWKDATEQLTKLIADANCGGAELRKSYRDAANRVLKATVPEATPLTETDWCVASIKTDGTREISFANTTENSRVDLVHPVGGPPYVASIDFHHQRVEVVQPKEPEEPKAPGNAAAKEKDPWRAIGKVVDGDGKPMKGVTVHAGTGMGTLLGSSKATTDADGNYELHFGPGISIGNDDVQLQFATISAHLPGHFEKNMSRQGDLLMARKMPEKFDWDRYRKDAIILPNQPRRVDYVMLPAAKLVGTLIDEKNEPLPGYSVSLTGKELPPSAGVIGQTKTDEKGRFNLAQIPTTFQFQILVEPPNQEPPWNGWASGPLLFQASNDDFFIKETDREVEANRFELQIKGPGVNWKEALQIGANHQKLEPTGDYLTSKSRLHAATIRLELNPKKKE